MQFDREDVEYRFDLWYTVEMVNGDVVVIGADECGPIDELKDDNEIYFEDLEEAAAEDIYCQVEPFLDVENPYLENVCFITANAGWGARYHKEGYLPGSEWVLGESEEEAIGALETLLAEESDHEIDLDDMDFEDDEDECDDAD